MPKKQRNRYYRDGEVSFGAFAHAIGDFLYRTGFHAEYFILSIGRAEQNAMHAITSSVAWTVKSIIGMVGPFLVAAWEDLVAPWKALRTVKQGNVKERRALMAQAFAFVLPLVALLIFAFTVNTIMHSTFALSVDFNEGELQAFIRDESVYDAAHTIIQQRIQGVEDFDVISKEADFRITIVEEAALSSPVQLANQIIATSDEHVTEATGVTVDGALVGATANSAELTSLMDSVLMPYQQEIVDDSVTVQFRQDVEVVPGLYLTETLIQSQELMKKLTGQDPFTLPSGESITHNCLDVQTVHRVQYTQEIPYETVVTQTAALNWGEEQVQQAGSSGIKEVTADIIYMDDVEVQRDIIAEDVQVAPVTEYILYGTYNQYGNDTGSVGDGNLIWPVPDYKRVSRNASLPYGHRGMDIAGNYGTVILAADNGVVEVSQNGAGTYNWSYGNFIKIDHGNGMTTLYGHCSELLVSVGEYVVKGQPIARMGSTGRSTGNHLHFEVARNGVLQMPTNYVTAP